MGSIKYRLVRANCGIIAHPGRGTEESASICSCGLTSDSVLCWIAQHKCGKLCRYIYRPFISRRRPRAVMISASKGLKLSISATHTLQNLHSLSVLWYPAIRNRKFNFECLSTAASLVRVPVQINYLRISHLVYYNFTGWLKEEERFVSKSFWIL